MTDSTTGALIDGRYKVLSRVGAGGMADVLLAEDQQLGRKVALKLMYRRFSEDPGFVERFRREAQAAAGLQHPNVVSVYDRGAYDDTYYIAMEYLPGRSLKQLIRAEAPLDQVRAIDITLQILKAARFAHRRGVIHRDLKPHNVIVDESDHAKVTDFGIARAGASDMTETGSIMGTAQYLSPEQAQGLAVSEASDLYSIGVILYELVTGRVPFDAEAAVTIAIKHVSEAPLPPSAINPAVAPELEQVILWALNKNPSDRPTNADELIAALAQVRAMIESRSAGERTASFAAVSSTEGWGAAALVGVAAAAVPDTVPPAGAVVVAEDAHTGYPPPPPLGPRRRRWPWLAVLLLVLLLGGGAAAYLLTRPQRVSVPPVAGQQIDVAQTLLQNQGFRTTINYRMDSHRAGTVIAQDPLGDSQANKGSTVALTVSQGPGDTSIPSVSFLGESDAKHAIEDSRLRVGRVHRENSDTIPPGDATRTDPRAGTTLPVGSAVTLFVSSGPRQVAVPDVVGQSQDSATAQLSGDGFTVETTTQTSSSGTPGTVISQDPGGGATVAPGSRVTIVIAQAPPKANVPNVTGQTSGAARGALEGAGFSVSSQSQDVSDPAQNDVVVSQNPSGGSSEIKGSTVTIVVGRLKSTTTTTTSSSKTSTGPSKSSTSSSTTSTTTTSSP
ncbi:MAG: Stk1 family PASTA domain-containing Ser/Thr kinase [Solirubrobacterales bacterium]|nr:Stk1 family PASTA domain-containing Ser/Thr kinase [Solirubrobacterales bacterium]